MDLYQQIFNKHLTTIQQQGRYRIFVELERTIGHLPYATYQGKSVVVWCSNDYLGMSQHPSVIQAMQEALQKAGAGSGGTRNISGTQHYHRELEQELAGLHHKPAALLFSSGYVANQATLSTLAGKLPDCMIFSDSENHASLIHGIRESKADRQIFKHNDLAHLEQLLSSIPLERPKIIVFESVYSMSGDIAPIKEIVALAKRYRALTYLDEVHGVGLYGKEGGGVAEALGLQDEIDIICGNFGKTYGVMGGYIAAAAVTVDFVRSFAGPFIFTTSLPPVLTAGALASIRHLRHSQTERQALHQTVQKVKAALSAADIAFIDNSSHMIPILIGNAAHCQAISQGLLQDHGIYVQAVNYPTVPMGTERFRVTPTPFHNDTMIAQLVRGLQETYAKFGFMYTHREAR